MRFRVFDKRENKHYFDAEYLVDSMGDLFFHDVEVEELLAPTGDYFEIQHSTGLTDVNGKEIFEGDFVEWELESGTKYYGKVGLSPTNASFIIDTSGRHLIGDDKYGDFCHMHRSHKYKITKQ